MGSQQRCVNTTFYAGGVKIRSGEATVTIGGETLKVVTGGRTPSEGQIHVNSLDMYLGVNSVQVDGITLPFDPDALHGKAGRSAFDPTALKESLTDDQYKKLTERLSRQLDQHSTPNQYTRAIAGAYLDANPDLTADDLVSEMQLWPHATQFAKTNPKEFEKLCNQVSQDFPYGLVVLAKAGELPPSARSRLVAVAYKAPDALAMLTPAERSRTRVNQLAANDDPLHLHTRKGAEDLASLVLAGVPFKPRKCASVYNQRWLDQVESLLDDTVTSPARREFLSKLSSQGVPPLALNNALKASGVETVSPDGVLLAHRAGVDLDKYVQLAVEDVRPEDATRLIQRSHSATDWEWEHIVEHAADNPAWAYAYSVLPSHLSPPAVVTATRLFNRRDVELAAEALTKAGCHMRSEVDVQMFEKVLKAEKKHIRESGHQLVDDSAHLYQTALVASTVASATNSAALIGFVEKDPEAVSDIGSLFSAAEYATTQSDGEFSPNYFPVALACCAQIALEAKSHGFPAANYQSLLEEGFNPVLAVRAASSGVDGHGVLLAAKELGWFSSTPGSESAVQEYIRACSPTSGSTHTEALTKARALLS